MKNITVENLGKLSAWKEKREQMENRLKRKWLEFWGQIFIKAKILMLIEELT